MTVVHRSRRLRCLECALFACWLGSSPACSGADAVIDLHPNEGAPQEPSDAAADAVGGALCSDAARCLAGQFCDQATSRCAACTDAMACGDAESILRAQADPEK